MTRPRLAVALVLTLAQLLGNAYAQAPSPTTDRRLTVAVRDVPPFSMRGADGEWEGLSVLLWEDVAERLGVEFDWRELPLTETFTGLHEGEVDAAITALTVSREREQRTDFSHPYHVGGLILAYRDSGGSAWWSTLRSFLSFEFLTAVGSLAIVLFAAGAALWIFERRHNSEQFGKGKLARGLGDGFWWSAVTMTTVGYGDKAPLTLGGRVVAVVWMFTSMIIVAGFTASIAASLTANRLEASLLETRGLGELHVAVLAGSTSEAYAASRGAKRRAFGTLEEALGALERSEVDAVLHDAPILRHRAQVDYPWLRLAARPVVREDYGFALPAGSELREPINAELLTILPEPSWDAVLRKYLGTE